MGRAAYPTCVAVLAGPALPAAALVATVDQVTVTVITYVVNAFVNGYRKKHHKLRNSKMLHTKIQINPKYKCQNFVNKITRQN